MQKGFSLVVILIFISILVAAGGVVIINKSKIQDKISPSTSNQLQYLPSISQIQHDSEESIKSLPGRVQFVHVSKNGKVGVVKQIGNGSDELWEINGNNEQKILDDTSINAFSYSPDGNKLIYRWVSPTSTATATVYNIIFYDLISKKKITLGKIVADGMPNLLGRWSKDSSEFWFDDYIRQSVVYEYKTSLKKFDIDTGILTTVLDEGSVYDLSPDLTKYISFNSNKNAFVIFVIKDLQTGEQRRLTELSSLIDKNYSLPKLFSPRFVWSSDNKNVAFVIAEEGPKGFQCKFYILNIDSKNLDAARIVDSNSNESCVEITPLWSPKGKYLQIRTKIISSNLSDPDIDGVIDEIHGGGPVNTLYGATWSSDEKMFVDNIKGKLSIFHIDTSKTIPIDVDDATHGYAMDARDWFADGTRLFYISKGKLMSIKNDGTDKKVLTR